jgi:hypothetical protein
VQPEASVKTETYDNKRKCAHEDKSVEREYPDSVLPFDNPMGDGDPDAELLLAVRMSILLQVLANSLIGQAGQIRVLAGHHKSRDKLETHDL